MMVIQPDERFSKIVDEVARQIVTTEHFGAGSVIKTPLLYPSGAAVVVEISQHGDRFFISDMGFGYQEAEMYGASRAYQRGAPALAEQFGISFDNQSFFVAEASQAQLAGATTVVANCSSEAASHAAYKAAERRYEDDSDLVYSRLVSVFPKGSVERNVEISGSSNHKWPISAVLQERGRVVLFEPVSKYHVSVVNTATKFHDIARLERAPKRVALVKSKSELGDLVNVLSQAGSVVEYSVPDETLRRIAEAA